MQLLSGWGDVSDWGESSETDTGDEDATLFAFDTGGGTKHLNQSLKTDGRYPNNAPDFAGAIEVVGSNTDIIVQTARKARRFWSAFCLPACFANFMIPARWGRR